MGYFTERRFERKFKTRNGVAVHTAKSKPKCNIVKLENPKKNKKHRAKEE